MELGELIRERRKAAGITMRELARWIGVSPSYLSAIEREIIVPRRALFVEFVAKELGESPDRFVHAAGLLPSDLVDGLKKHPEAWDKVRELIGL